MLVTIAGPELALFSEMQQEVISRGSGPVWVQEPGQAALWTAIWRCKLPSNGGNYSSSRIFIPRQSPACPSDGAALAVPCGSSPAPRRRQSIHARRTHRACTTPNRNPPNKSCRTASQALTEEPQTLTVSGKPHAVQMAEFEANSGAIRLRRTQRLSPPSPGECGRRF